MTISYSPLPDKFSCPAFFMPKQRRINTVLYIREFTDTAHDADYKFCTSHTRRIECFKGGCSNIVDQTNVGIDTYEKAVLALIPSTSSISKRLPKLIQEYPGSLWANAHHKSRMEEFNNHLGYRKSRNTSSYYAAMYLLTSNDELHWRTSNCFYTGGIEFCYAVLRGISPHNYSLYYAAKGLCLSKGVTESELADPEVIDDDAFRLIVNALLIVKYGTTTFELKGDIRNEP